MSRMSLALCWSWIRVSLMQLPTEARTQTWSFHSPEMPLEGAVAKSSAGH
jgi:hypothetical protein